MTGRPLIPVDFPDRRKGVWIFAATLALCCHLAFIAFAIARMNDEPDDDDLGAPGIEIAFELASPQTSPSDLPPGPESDASAASPPVVEQKATVKDVDLPKEIPVEAKEPDRLVTIEKSEKPVEEEPDVTAKMVKPVEETVAQEATAAPAIQDAPEAPKSTTLAQGTAESRQRARVTWQKELLAHLNKYKRYPVERSQKSSEILVTLNLDRTGRVLAVNVAKSSGDEAFDHAALTMVERASPVPAPPPLVADEGLSFSLPVIFRKNSR
jgi:protein TonB